PPERGRAHDRTRAGALSRVLAQLRGAAACLAAAGGVGGARARRPELSILVSLRAAGHLRRPVRRLRPCPAPLGHAGMARRRTRPLERPALLRAEPRRPGAIPRARARDAVAARRVQLA